MLKKSLFILILILSSNSFANTGNILQNSIWNIEKSEHWKYDPKYNIAYITKNDAILVVFKDHFNKYGLFYYDKETKNRNEHQIFFKIDDGEFKGYNNLEYGSSITKENTLNLVNKIRRKNTITATSSLLYSNPTTFNLVNSYDSIGLLNPSHPKDVLLNDVYINKDSFNDIVHTGIQLIYTNVGKTSKYKNGFIEQWFEVDNDAHDIDPTAYPKIILNYKRKTCKENSYLWDGDLGYHFKIKIKKTSNVINQNLDYLCFIEWFLYNILLINY